MNGVVKFFNRKKGYGFIYGTGCIEKDGKVDVLPEYFVHTSQVGSKRLRSGDMVKFEPHEDEKGLSAVNVLKKGCCTENDPRCYIAQRIFDEFDFEIPCMSWMWIGYEEMKDIFNYLNAKKNQDSEELKCIEKEYELDRVTEDDVLRCIAAGGYEFWRMEEDLNRKEMLTVARNILKKRKLHYKKIRDQYGEEKYVVVDANNVIQTSEQGMTAEELCDYAYEMMFEMQGCRALKANESIVSIHGPVKQKNNQVNKKAEVQKYE